MADITDFQHGQPDDSGKVNWRGDQVSVPQGGQSIYKSSSVQLAELGERKVVGDRVFRYARANGTIGAGDVCQGFVDNRINVTAGASDPAGGFIFTWYAATTQAANLWAEGYLISQSGTAANLGYTYRVKSHAAASGTNVALTLYDPLVKVPNTADKWSIFSNAYAKVTECTAGTAPPVGVCPIAVTTNDYFWLQTWGPCGVKTIAGTDAGNVQAGATGQVNAPILATTAGAERAYIGYALHTFTASEYGLVFLTIAP